MSKIQTYRLIALFGLLVIVGGIFRVTQGKENKSFYSEGYYASHIQETLPFDGFFGTSGDKLLEDTFTDTNGVNLVDHTPDTGTSWTVAYQAGDGTYGDEEIQSNQTINTTGDSSEGIGMIFNGTYDSDYQVVVDLVDITGSDDYFSPMIRMTDNGSDNIDGYYIHDLSPSTSDDLWLYRVDGNVCTTVTHTFNQGEAGGVVWGDGSTFLFQAVGDTISACNTADDTCQVYIEDTGTGVTGGSAGYITGRTPCQPSGDINTANNLDNFVVYEIAANNTGWNDPTTTGETDNSWTNPTNAYSSDGSDATEDTLGQMQDYGDFGFDGEVTADATIYGIEVKLENADNTSNWHDVGIEISFDNGSTWETQKILRWEGTTDVDGVGGHARALWGASPTRTDILDSDFRIRLDYQAEQSSSSGARVDHVQARVFWTLENSLPTITSETSNDVRNQETMSFSVDWADGDAHDTKTKICKTDSLTNMNCDGGFYASSTSYASTDPSVTTFTARSEDIGHHQFYAFVCDTLEGCSTSTMGDFTINGTSTPAELLNKAGKIINKAGIFKVWAD